MKVEADKLKRVATGGKRTKVIALGVGSIVSQAELNNIASAPASRNVILVQDFSSLPDVEEQLRNASCSGQLSSVIHQLLDHVNHLADSNFFVRMLFKNVY